MQLIGEDEKLMERLGEVPVALVEKGKGPGSHLMSGAMMDPSAMKELFPDLPEEEWPTYGTVPKDTVYFMTRKRAIPLVPTPPPFFFAIDFSPTARPCGPRISPTKRQQRTDSQPYDEPKCEPDHR